MDELLVGVQAADGIELLLDEILHGLDVVVGDGLDLLDARRILLGEVAPNGAQTLSLHREALELRQGQLAERNEILYLHTHTIANEGKLGEIRRKGFCLAAIATVYGRYRGQRI